MLQIYRPYGAWRRGLQTCCYKHAAPTGLGGGLQTCCYKYAAPTGLGRHPLNPL
ncbi:hypothetical protein [Desulfonema magnum]|uniref:hypothetical protein n=1 Tax=Desulfonema magnum TaxID=45655 RepID=UPI001A9AD792|nr:hypothetical protein [Desulfonema magnum]